MFIPCLCFKFNLPKDCTLIRLLDYALCIILIEGANVFDIQLIWKEGKLGYGFFMFMIWITMMTKKTLLMMYCILSLVIVCTI